MKESSNRHFVSGACFTARENEHREKRDGLSLNMKTSTTREIIHLLTSIGVPSNYTGVKQTAYAVALVLENSELLNFVTKRLYPAVAKCDRTTPTSVERNIRTIVQIIWENNPAALCGIAGYQMKHKPTNSQFVAILVDYLQR